MGGGGGGYIHASIRRHTLISEKCPQTFMTGLASIASIPAPIAAMHHTSVRVPLEATQTFMTGVAPITAPITAMYHTSCEGPSARCASQSSAYCLAGEVTQTFMTGSAPITSIPAPITAMHHTSCEGPSARCASQPSAYCLAREVTQTFMTGLVHHFIRWLPCQRLTNQAAQSAGPCPVGQSTGEGGGRNPVTSE